MGHYQFDLSTTNSVTYLAGGLLETKHIPQRRTQKGYTAIIFKQATVFVLFLSYFIIRLHMSLVTQLVEPVLCVYVLIR